METNTNCLKFQTGNKLSPISQRRREGTYDDKPEPKDIKTNNQTSETRDNDSEDVPPMHQPQFDETIDVRPGEKIKYPTVTTKNQNENYDQGSTFLQQLNEDSNDEVVEQRSQIKRETENLANPPLKNDDNETNEKESYTDDGNNETDHPHSDDSKCSSQSMTKKHVSWDETAEQLNDSQNVKKKLDKKVNRIMLTLYLLAFLASFSYWVQSGVLPYLTRRVGMNTELFGLMESTYALYQMITSPLYGRLGDLFGVRILYLVSEIASSITFGSLAFADSVPELFLTRIPALFMHSVQCSYMIITDITCKRARAGYIGKLGVLHGLGMIAGSVVGGVVTHFFDEKTSAIVAAISNLASVVVIFCMIPENTKDINQEVINLQQYSPNASPQKSSRDCSQQQQTDDTTSNTGQREATIPTFSAMLSVLTFKNVKFLMLMKVSIAFPFSLLYSMFSMAVMDYYGLGPRTNGLLLGYVGLLSMFVQGVVVGALTKRFEDAPIVKAMIFFNTVGFLFLIVSTSIFVLVIVVVPLAVGGSVSHIVLMAVITKIVPPEHSGTALGFIFALHAIVRAIAPTVGGLIFANLGWPFFGVVGYAFHLVLMVYVWMCGRDDQYDG